jgi:hypothetical protein
VALLALDLRSPALAVVTGGPGLTLLVLLAAALLAARSGWIGLVLGLLALLFFAHLLVAGESGTETAAIVGVLLLLAGELGQWSIDGRLAGRYERSLHVTRALGIALLGLLGVAVAFLAMVASGLPTSGGIETVAIGMAAAVGVLWLLSYAAARAPSRSSPRDLG